MRLDPVTLEILSTKIAAVAQEMGNALYRSGRTLYVKETCDFATGLLNTEGKVVSYPAHIGVNGMIDNDAKPTIDLVGPLEEGDVIVTNHPYASVGLSTHIPDVHVLKPYFSGGKIICFGWCFVHVSDLGGRVPSSISPSNTDIFQEGLMLPPLKLMRRGEFNHDVMAIIRANSRTPEENVGDMRAMVATLAVGERRVQSIVAQHDAQTFSTALGDVVAYAAAKSRQAFRTIPDGEYEFSDYLDDAFLSSVPVRIHTRLTVDDGKLHFDFSETDPQVRAAFNMPTAGKRHPWLTVRIAQYALTCDPSIPLNYGLFEPVRVTIPEGTLLHPTFPAAVGVRHASAKRVHDVINGVFAQAAPGFMRAAGGGLIAPVVLAEPEDDRGRRKVIVLEPMIGGMGAGLGLEGVDGRDSITGGMQNNPIESVESAAEVTILRYGIRSDSGGPGRWRGGVGLELTFTPHLAGSNVLGRGMERFRFSPWGVAGGKAGGLARTIKNYGRPDEEELGKIDMLEIAPGDTMTVMTPGGGGYGSPLERDPEAVADDVNRGFVTVAGALDDYGVVIRNGAVNIEATQRLRGQRTAASKHDAPFFDFGPEREKWERVFDSARMRRINRAIMALPSTQRLSARDKIFEPMITLLRKGVVLDERLLMLVSPAVERNLIALERLVTESTAHEAGR